MRLLVSVSLSTSKVASFERDLHRRGIGDPALAALG